MYLLVFGNRLTPAVSVESYMNNVYNYYIFRDSEVVVSFYFGIIAWSICREYSVIDNGVGVPLMKICLFLLQVLMLGRS